MKLFKNKVGRPSNEIKESRKVFIISIIALIITLITIGVATLTNVSSNKLKGGSLLPNSTEYYCYPNFDEDNDQWEVKEEDYNKGVCHSNRGWSIFSLFEKRIYKNYKLVSKTWSLVYKDNFILGDLDDTGIPGTKNKNVSKVKNVLGNYKFSVSFYYGVMDYCNNADCQPPYYYTFMFGYKKINDVTSLVKGNPSDVFLHAFASKSSNALYKMCIDKKCGYDTYDERISGVKTPKIDTIKYKEGNHTLEVYYLNRFSNKYISMYSGNFSCSNGVCKETSSSSTEKSSSNNTKKDGLKLNCPTAAYVGEKFTCTTNSTKATVRVSKEGLSDYYLSLLKQASGRFKTPKKEVNLMYTKKGYAKVVAEQSGYKAVTERVEIREKDGLKLDCPTFGVIGEKFTCTTNSTKATVRVSKEGLSDHYLSLLKQADGRFKTPKREVNLMYMKKGYAKVVAEQAGYKAVTEHVEIRDPLKLSCPESSNDGEVFTCTTSEDGATISVTSTGLANGYSSTFKTTENNHKMAIKYTAGGYKTVTVSKKGYNTVTEKVLVTGITEMKFDCPTSAKVGQAFKCTTNLENVIITVSGCELERGYTNKFTTTKNDKAKLTACRNKGTVTVEAYHDTSRRKQQKIVKKVKITK